MRCRQICAILRSRCAINKTPTDRDIRRRACLFLCVSATLLLNILGDSIKKVPTVHRLVITDDSNT